MDEPERIDSWKQGIKSIMKCIGKIDIDFGDRDMSGNKLMISGTGMVFKVKDGFAYILTAASNVVDTDDDGNHKLPVSIQFIRQASRFRDEQYSAVKSVFHHDYMYKNDDDELVRMQSNDLAVVAIQDHDHFFSSLFAQNSFNVDLFCSDNIDNTASDIVYNLYGYPMPRGKYLAAEHGELWGMKAPAFGRKDETELYVKKNKKGSEFIYNAIHTTAGFTGAPLFIEQDDGKFSIVGVHTRGGMQKRSGVALNKGKMDWINNHVQ